MAHKGSSNTSHSEELRSCNPIDSSSSGSLLNDTLFLLGLCDDENLRIPLGDISGGVCMYVTPLATLLSGGVGGGDSSSILLAARLS